VRIAEYSIKEFEPMQFAENVVQRLIERRKLEKVWKLNQIEWN
jgi:hypothetical protein